MCFTNMSINFVNTVMLDTLQPALCSLFFLPKSDINKIRVNMDVGVYMTLLGAYLSKSKITTTTLFTHRSPQSQI